MVAITVHGGVAEVGGNKVLVDFGGSRFLLDFGLSFKRMGEYYEEFLQPRTASQLHDLLRLGLLPSLHGIYRDDALRPLGLAPGHPTDPLWGTGLRSYEEVVKSTGTAAVDAMLLSHGHDDHCGLAPLLGPMTTVLSRECRIILEATVEIGDLTGLDKDLMEVHPRRLGHQKKGGTPGAETVDPGEGEARPAVVLEGHQRKVIGGVLDVEVEAFPVGHSLPGAFAYLLESKGQQVVYTGDLRFTGRKGTDLREKLRGLRPTALLVEGTRILEKDVHHEVALEDQLEGHIRRCQGLAMVGFRWKDLDRFETVLKATRRAGRELVVFPKLAYLLNKFGTPAEALGVKVFLERTESMLYSPADYGRDKYKAGYSMDWKAQAPDLRHLDHGVRALDLHREPHRFVLQLDHYRFNNLQDIQPPLGSLYIRANTEPFNEEMEFTETRLCNWLRAFDLNQPDYRPIQVHASGHASGPELQELVDALQPRHLIPLHTEHPDAFDGRTGRLRIPAPGATIEV